jgi:hypothetical protein
MEELITRRKQEKEKQNRIKNRQAKGRHNSPKLLKTYKALE